MEELQQLLDRGDEGREVLFDPRGHDAVRCVVAVRQTLHKTQGDSLVRRTLGSATVRLTSDLGVASPHDDVAVTYFVGVASFPNHANRANGGTARCERCRKP